MVGISGDVVEPGWFQVARWLRSHQTMPLSLVVLLRCLEGSSKATPLILIPPPKKGKELRVVMRNKPAECCVPGFTLLKDPPSMPCILPLEPGGHVSSR